MDFEQYEHLFADEPLIDRANMAILYGYGTNTALPMLKRSGVWVAPAPVPLSHRQIERCLKLIAEHESYDGWTIIAWDSERIEVRLEAGQVKVSV